MVETHFLPTASAWAAIWIQQKNLSSHLRSLRETKGTFLPLSDILNAPCHWNFGFPWGSGSTWLWRDEHPGIRHLLSCLILVESIYHIFMKTPVIFLCLRLWYLYRGNRHDQMQRVACRHFSGRYYWERWSNKGSSEILLTPFWYTASDPQLQIGGTW